MGEALLAEGSARLLAAPPNLRVHARGEFRAHVEQRFLYGKCGWMRTPKDPSSPLDQVLQDGLGFKQVVACVEVKMSRVDAATFESRRWSRVHLGSFVRVAATVCVSESVTSWSDPSVRRAAGSSSSHKSFSSSLSPRGSREQARLLPARRVRSCETPSVATRLA